MRFPCSSLTKAGAVISAYGIANKRGMARQFARCGALVSEEWFRRLEIGIS